MRVDNKEIVRCVNCGINCNTTVLKCSIILLSCKSAATVVCQDCFRSEFKIDDSEFLRGAQLCFLCEEYVTIEQGSATLSNISVTITSSIVFHLNCFKDMCTHSFFKKVFD
jgi:hypothetical protein